MYIVHAAAEMAQIAKVGGLGDVLYALPKEQISKGHRVTVIIPKYDTIDLSVVNDLKVEVQDLWSYEGGQKYHNSVWSCTFDGIDVKLIDPHTNSYYFNRGTIYGCMNDIERFLYFSRAVCEYLYSLEETIDVLHIHDWQTAAIAPIIKTVYKDVNFSPKAIVCTIHNIEHQGKCTTSSLSRIGLRGDEMRTEERMQDPLDDCLVNLLKGGIVYSDYVTTVSPRYANEILTEEYGFGLERCVQKHKAKLAGILNGIELSYWNPANDRYLAENYPTNPSFLPQIIEKKEENKKALYKRLKMHPSSKGPLVIAVTRIAKQKGHKLIQEAAHYILDKGGIFIVLGSSHDKQMEKEFDQLKNLYKTNSNLYISLSFDEELAHLLYAAADSILIPSIFEPCGLTQMISMRYGTIPIARSTGGLADTVFDCDNPKIAKHQRTGFLFEEPNHISMKETLDRAFRLYNKHPADWQQLMKNSFNFDSSWKASAKEYLSIYKHAIKTK